MPDDQLDDVDWTLATWEGHRRRQHAEFRALSFREEVAAMERMGMVSAAFARRVLRSESSHSRGGRDERVRDLHAVSLAREPIRERPRDRCCAAESLPHSIAREVASDDPGA
jgi:hypothetical protein